MGMAAKKLDLGGVEDHDDNATVQFNVRVPRFLLKELDAWLDDINQGRRVGKVNRSDLVRLLLDKACRERPDLEGK